MSDRNSTEQLSSSLPSLSVLSSASSHSSPFIATPSNFNREKVELKQNSPLLAKENLFGAVRDSQHEQIASEEHFKEQSRLAQAGDPVAWFNVGVCYAMGYGVEKNGTEAISCFQKAAEQGHVEALYGLAICYVTGCGLVAKDAIAAASWLKKAAEKEYVAAQFHLGAWYESGYGVIKNEAAALRWYKRAAANGDLDAQTNAGVCYLKGEGAEKDEAAAVSCFRKAAKRGHAGAQNNLGVCYEKGLGAWKSEGAMRYWYERAAIQGNASAQANLARIRRNNVAPAAFVPPHAVLDSFSHSSPEGFPSSSAFQMATRTPVNTSSPPDMLERLSPRVETTGQMAEGKPIPSKSQTSWALHAGPFEGNLALSEELALSKALFHALKRQDINAVKSLVAKGAPLNVKNSREDTPLLVAVKKGYLAAVDALLNAEEGSASVDQAGNSGQTPLVMAVMAGRLDIGTALLRRGANYQHSRQWLISHGEKHLSEEEHKKAQEAIVNLDMLYRQADKGVQARAQSAKEFTERFFLSGLQEKAVDEQTTSSSFQTTTYTPVAIPSRLDTREQLSPTLETKGQAGAERLPDKSLAHWALHAGALEGNLVLSEELASSKALFHALKRQDINAVKSLVAKGAPLNAKNSKEDMPLQIAVRKGFLEAVDVFLGAEKSSALVDQADKSGQTPLVMAVIAGHLDIGAALLRRGADYQHSRQWLISHLLGKGLPERECTKAQEALANLDVLHCQVGKGVQVAEEQPAKEFTDGFLISALQEKVAGGQMATSERTTVDTIVAQFWRDAGVGGNEKELLKFSQQYPWLRAAIAKTCAVAQPPLSPAFLYKQLYSGFNAKVKNNHLVNAKKIRVINEASKTIQMSYVVTFYCPSDDQGCASDVAVPFHSPIIITGIVDAKDMLTLRVSSVVVTKENAALLGLQWYFPAWFPAHERAASELGHLRKTFEVNKEDLERLAKRKSSLGPGDEELIGLYIGDTAYLRKLVELTHFVQQFLPTQQKELLSSAHAFYRANQWVCHDIMVARRMPVNALEWLFWRNVHWYVCTSYTLQAVLQGPWGLFEFPPNMEARSFQHFIENNPTIPSLDKLAQRLLYGVFNESIKDTIAQLDTAAALVDTPLAAAYASTAAVILNSVVELKRLRPLLVNKIVTAMSSQNLSSNPSSSNSTDSKAAQVLNVNTIAECLRKFALDQSMELQTLFESPPSSLPTTKNNSDVGQKGVETKQKDAKVTASPISSSLTIGQAMIEEIEAGFNNSNVDALLHLLESDVPPADPHVQAYLKQQALSDILLVLAPKDELKPAQQIKLSNAIERILKVDPAAAIRPNKKGVTPLAMATKLKLSQEIIIRLQKGDAAEVVAASSEPINMPLQKSAGSLGLFGASQIFLFDSSSVPGQSSSETNLINKL